ncbi:hypothetical protein GTA08_BOTSDO12937 [Botryosphaeria dothidea]|uniref:Xaa-Pro dipeptidyl-peptidase C-terminal domain-containing protein n=1 Tax=Botryosphaeria dothidea TaxID=55169 RepID=A0A8H4J1D5_9PEZI|nr:hypothetical protein GTA08_BOTSDO12937 [Botryosphaeria dothidea]
MVVGTMWSSSGVIITAVALLAQTPLAISNDTNGGRIVNSTLPIYNDDAYPVVFRQAMPLNASRARYPGFKPSNTTLKAGTLRREGAKPLPVDIVFERDVAVTLRDGTVIYTDVFRPATNEKAPVLVAWSPYGKEVGGQWLDDVTNRSSVPLSSVSELQKFEAPDPAYWVAHGYAVLNPDARGSGMSGGDITYWGRQMAQDGYDFVAFSGNSFLAASQWFIAAEQPPHLAAIAPWEGLSDLFRDVTNRGGIAQLGFIESVGTTFSGRGLVEDLARMMLTEQLITPYWEDKEARLERVQVPAYVVASYTNALHTHGTFEGFRRIQSAAKWLRVHNSYEWPDYYDEAHVQDLRKFFDYYLKNITDNGWDETPRVRMAVLDPGANDTLDRTAEDWPPQGIQTRSFFLAANGSLVNDNPAGEASVSYAVNGSSGGGGQAQFRYQVREPTEIVGYMKPRLWVEAVGSDDMELSVTVMKLAANGTAYTAAAASESTGPYATGYLRVSQRALDTARSTPSEPRLRHDREQRLRPGDVVPVDIPLWPIALRFRPGEQMAVTVAAAAITPASLDAGFGLAVVPVPADGATFEPGANVSVLLLGGDGDVPAFVDAQRVETPASRNRGTHVIHFGGAYDSHLLVPVNSTGF